ncbi:MAG: penicillin-binding protein 1C [Filomicrobium sp.]
MRVSSNKALNTKPSRRSWRRWAGIMVLALTITTLAGWASFEAAVRSLPPLPLKAAGEVSVTVLDRDDRLLRAFTTKEGRWRLPVSHKNVDERYLQMLMAFEDRRYWQHGGVDVLALARAALQFATNGRIVSGASTLTMQTARLLDESFERSMWVKVRQILRAVQLERQLSKAEILDLYLRLAPFGGNIEGTRAASLAYFGKEPVRLTVAQAALLVALPQSPEMRRPDRHLERAKAARKRVLQRAVETGIIAQADADRAMAEKIPTRRKAFPMLAPHLAEKETANDPQKRVHRLTINAKHQQALQRLIAIRTKELGQRLSGALIAIDHATGEIIAHVGSPGYLDKSRFGAIDMTEALRSPGSTLKPIVYGLGFERGLAHPETLIEDRPTRFGTYRPENFDETYRGTVTIREALGQSLNVPAVRVLDELGPDFFIGRLRRAGLTPVLPEAARPSLAVALGGLGLTLKDLAGLYASLAQGGRYVEVTHRVGEAEQRRLSGEVAKDARRRLLSQLAAWYIGDILKDAPAPANARSGRIAYKTGTSYGYRDAFAIGYDGRTTIAVWVGRPDGASTPGLIGRVAAAPILFDAFARISATRTPLPAAPRGALRVSGTDLPPNLKRFGRTTARDSDNAAFAHDPLLISFPPDRSELTVELSGDALPLQLKAEGGALPLTWLIDGKPISSDPHRRAAFWQPKGPGFTKVSVIDAQGKVDRVTVRLSQ